MEKKAWPGPLRRKTSSARVAVSAVLACLLFVATAPFAHAQITFHLLQGEERTVDEGVIAQLFEAQVFDNAQFEAGELEIRKDDAGGFILVAKQPTSDVIPVTLVLEGGNGQTVTKDVYVKIHENNPPVIVPSEITGNDSPFMGRGILLPGYAHLDYNQIYVDARVFKDPDEHFFDVTPPVECTNPDSCPSFDDHQAESLTYVVEGLPSFIHYEIIEIDFDTEALMFFADENAQPGVYTAEVYAVDIAGQRSEPVYLHLHVMEFAPRETAMIRNVSLADGVDFYDLIGAYRHIFLGESLYYTISYLEINHLYGETVQVCDTFGSVCDGSDNKLAPGQSLRFAEPGVYDLSIVAVIEVIDYENNTVAGTIKATQPLFARVYVDEFSVLDGWFLANWPFLSVADEHGVYMPFPGTLYIVPYQEDITTADQVEALYQLYEDRGAVKKAGEGSHSLEDLRTIKNVSDRVSLYVVDEEDGTILYEKHFMLVDNPDLTVKEIVDYYRQPLYPSDNEIILEMLLHTITPATSDW